MADPEGADEFDTIPDAFEDVDFSAIPELNYASSGFPAQQHDGDASEDFSDPFEGVDWSNIPELGDHNVADTGPAESATHHSGVMQPPSRGVDHQTAPSPVLEQLSSGSSHGISSDMSEPQLQELDAQEDRSPHSPVPRALGGEASALIPGSLSRGHTQPQRSSQKKRKHQGGSPSGTPKKKRKKRKSKKVDIEAGVKLVLEQFEDELTCPICCDILALAHTGNPCGHAFCGECGWGWISKHRRAPTCAICRAQLDRAAPMVPNYVADNLVSKHVSLLPISGDSAWLPGGLKYEEWIQRKERWKASTIKTSTKRR